MATCINCGEDKITVDQIKKGIFTCTECAEEQKLCATCGKPTVRFFDQKKRCLECARAAYNKRNSIPSTFAQKPKSKAKAPRRDNEEAYSGSCKGGCGKAVTGEYVCYACREKAKAKSFALKSGEIELWRGDVKDGDGRLTRQIVAVSADSIQPERMGWVWRDRIPDEAITWILGQPNNAKSLLTIEIAACATTGKAWPDGTENTMGAVDVLMLCFEDSLSKQVVPRLIAAGADLTRIKFLDRKSFRTHLDGDPEPSKKGLDLTEHLPALLEILKANPQFKLIIVDPIRDIFGKARMTHDMEVGPVLADLIEFCEKAHVAFVGVVHVPKHQTNSAMEKIAGGSAVAASAMRVKDLNVFELTPRLADALSASLDAAYLEYFTADCSGTSTSEAERRIASIPEEKRYLTRVLDSLDSAFADFDTETAMLDLPHMQNRKPEAIKRYLEFRLRQFRMLLDEVEDYVEEKFPATGGHS
jgi:hypothetical protein